MDDSIQRKMVKRLRVSRDAESAELLDFWHQHGKEWAREESSFGAMRRLVNISAAATVRPAEDAAPFAVGELKAIWHAGWSGTSEPYGWDEMDDMLPASAYLAFLQGVEAAWLEVRDQL